MNEIEKKVLKLFLTDSGLSQPEVTELISQSSLVNRDMDPVGFYTTIKIPEKYRKVFIQSQQWSKANGKTKDGVLVGFVIFPPSEKDNNILLEGFTYEGEYPQNEQDYAVSLDDLS